MGSHTFVPQKKPALDWPVVSFSASCGEQGVVIMFESFYSHQFVNVRLVSGKLLIAGESRRLLTAL